MIPYSLIMFCVRTLAGDIASFGRVRLPELNFVLNVMLIIFFPLQFREVRFNVQRGKFQGISQACPSRSSLRYGAVRFGACLEDISTWKKAGALMCS
jgi:hypothetical protein